MTQHTTQIHSSLSIAHQVILITGAYGLIGQTIAKAFLQQGARVVLADRNESLRATLQAELSADFPEDQFLFQTLDITQRK